jgi:hypothetical protein
MVTAWLIEGRGSDGVWSWKVVGETLDETLYMQRENAYRAIYTLVYARGWGRDRLRLRQVELEGMLEGSCTEGVGDDMKAFWKWRVRADGRRPV